MTSSRFIKPEKLPQAQALRSWTPTQCDVLAEKVRSLVGQWSDTWQVRAAMSTNAPETRPVTQSAASVFAGKIGSLAWSYEPGATARPVRVAKGDERCIAAIRGAMWGDAAANLPVLIGGSIASEVARDAWDDWCARLLVLFSGTHEVSGHGAALPAAWRGDVRLRWKWCSGRWSIDVPGAAVETLVSQETRPSRIERRRPAVSPLSVALKARRLRLQVGLSGSELSLGQLSTLRCGDVVPLQHALDAPLHVVGPGGSKLCSAWLGKRGKQIAIELTRDS